MRIESISKNIELVEFDAELGEWYVRWDIRHTDDGTTYEEEMFRHIPTLDDIKRVINEWHNHQIDGAVEYGFFWDNDRVFINEESKFNIKATFDMAVLLEQQVAMWDAEHPELAGISETRVMGKDEDGNDIESVIPTGRPQSLFPITFKFENDYHSFATLNELQEFYVSMLQYIQGQYASGWAKRDAFDYEPYRIALIGLGYDA